MECVEKSEVPLLNVILVQCLENNTPLTIQMTIQNVKGSKGVECI
jgi:hypothetical protein